MSTKDSNQNKTKIKELVKELGSLTLVEAAELVSDLKEEWGVSDSPVVVASSSSSDASDSKEVKQEKTMFDVKLSSTGDKKISVIKEVKSLFGLGLKEAKDLVDSVANAPQILKQGVKKDEADSIKSKLEGVGAKILVE
jgi:large subunit ribosomal protein L7/L12